MRPPPGPNVLALVRERCREVAAQASSVRIDPDRIAGYATTLAPAPPVGPAGGAPDPWATGATDAAAPSEEARAALVIALDAINFGSGYHPHVHKLPGCSGATTMATHLRAWAGREGGLDATRLAAVDPDAAHQIFDQPRTPPMAELMAAFAASLNELGRFVATEHGSSFLAMVGAADRSADRLVAMLAALPAYADRSPYRGFEVPFWKRAQITVADLHRAFAGQGPGTFVDIDDLTAFADNLVPHVLRVDGVLVLDPELEATIDRGELLVHGSEPEVELRACGVHAVELLVAATAAAGVRASAADIDQVLWTRGGGARYKAVPRSRARTTAY